MPFSVHTQVRQPSTSTRPRPNRRRWVVLLASCGVLATLPVAAARADLAGEYAAGKVVVGYATRASQLGHTASAQAGSTGDSAESASHARLIHLPPGETVPRALRRLRRERGVVWAFPDYRAHA